jgi:cytochrome bd-type quinol oxidase subunit 1
MTWQTVIDWVSIAIGVCLATSLAAFVVLCVLAWRERPAGRRNDGQQ